MAIRARSTRSISDFSKPVRVPAAILAMSGLLLLTLLGPAMTILGNNAEGAGNVGRQAGYLLACMLTIAAMRPLHHPERLLVVPRPLIVALGWCWLSMIWAIDPSVAVRRLILTTIVLWSVFALVRQLGYERTLLTVRITLAVLLVVNFTTSLLLPTVGIHQVVEHDGLAGDWRGIMGHKNQAGLICALTIILFAFDRRKLPYWVMALPIVGSAIFLILSNSKTSIGLVAIALALGLGVALVNRRYAPALRQSRYVCACVAFVAIAALAMLFHFGIQSNLMLEYISDPGNLTGRTQIWLPMVKYYLTNPMLGAGYGSFWNINVVSPIKYEHVEWLKDVSEGHNGFLDLMITIGLPGLVIVLAATLVWPFGRLLSRPGFGLPTTSLIAATILFCILHNGTESSLFDRDTIGQVFLMLAIALLVNAETPTLFTKQLNRTHSEPVHSLVPNRPSFGLNERMNRPAHLPSSRKGRPKSSR